MNMIPFLLRKMHTYEMKVYHINNNNYYEKMST